MTGPHPGRTGRPRVAERHKNRGGKNKTPRSFGLTLEAVRDELGLDQAGMMLTLLEYIDPEHPVREYSREPDAMINCISGWETARTHPPFSIQYRYGRVSETWSGVLHLISLFYADLRDASDPTERDAKLSRVHEVADRLIALAQHAKAMAVDFEHGDYERTLGGEITDADVRERHKPVIRELLAAYRLARSIAP